MNESTLKILSQAARNAAREVGLEEDFDQHSAIAGYTNPNATIQVKKKRGSSTAVGGKPNLPGLPAPAQEESTQPVSAASALAGMQRGTDAKSVLAELLASGDTLAYGAAKQEFDAMEAAKKEKQQKAAQNPYGGAQALQNALSIKAEALNRRAESIADFQAKLEKRIADFNAGRGTDTQEQLNREIAALTLRKDVYNRDLAAYEKEYAQMSGIIRDGVQAVDAQIAKAQRDVEVYFSDAHGEMLDRQIQDAYNRQAAQAAAERDGTSLPNSRSASELWDEYLAAQDRYSQWETEKAEYSLSILPNDERQLLNRYVEAKNNQGLDYKGGYYGVEEVESRRKAVVDHFGKERAEQLIQMAERSYNAKRQQEENRKMAEYAQRGVGEAIVASVASIVTNALSAPGALVSTLAQKLHNPNNLRTLDTNTAGFSMQNATRSFRGGVQSAIMPDEANATAGQKAGVLLYSTLMSSLDSLVASSLPGNAGGVLLGATAATNTMQDVTERGGTMNQAITAGVVSGIFECLFEDVSIGKLKGLQRKRNVRSAAVFLQNVGKSIGVNASEEAATELANILYDSVALGDVSNYAIRLRELMEEPDMDESTAKQTLAGELAMQVMESAVSGALMGGVFGVLGSATAAVNTKRMDRLTNTLMLDGLIDQGLSYQGTEIFDIAAQMQERRNAGKLVPSEEITALAEKIQNQISRQKAQGAGMAEATNARATEAMLGLSESVQKIAEKPQKESGDKTQFSIEVVDGRVMTVIDTKNDTRDFDAAESYLKTLIDTENPFATILSDAQPVYIGKDLPDEYLHSKYTEGMRTSLREVKKQAATNLDEMLLLAENGEWRENVKKKHQKDAANGWYRYDTEFAKPIQNTRGEIDHYNIYEGTLLIRNDADGKSYLYDLLDIQEKKKAIPSPSSTAKVQSEIFEAMPSVDTTVPQNTPGVKSSIRNRNETDTQSALRAQAEETVRTVMESYPATVQEARITAVAQSLRETGETALADEVIRVWQDAGGENVVYYAKKAAENTAETEDTGYGREGETGGVRVREGRERDDGQSAGGSSRTVEGGTGRTAAADARRNVSAGQSKSRRVAERITRGGGQSTRAATGLRNASANNRYQVYALEEQDMDAEAYIILNDAERNGYRAHLYYKGLYFTLKNGKTVRVDGARAGEDLYIRMDAENFSGEQIANHEMFHALAEGNPGLVDAIMQDIMSEYTEEELEELVQYYSDLYRGVTDDVEKILGELCADAYAGMDRANVEVGKESYARVSQKTEAVRGMTERRTGLRAIGERGVAETRAGPRATKNATADAEAGEFSLVSIDGKYYTPTDADLIETHDTIEAVRVDGARYKPGIKMSKEEKDREYIKAVESGNLKKAERMVRDAAMDAGYTQLFYHGSKKGGGFTKFRDWSYFTENEKYARRYAERENEKSLYKVFVKAENYFDTRKKADQAIFEEARSELGLGDIQDTGLPDWTDGYDLAEYIDENELPYDGIILDEGGDLVNGEPVSRGFSYVIRKSNQIKSADPVTYDDDGNVIPLSERFNEEEQDIRFSLASGQSFEQVEERIDELEGLMENLLSEREDMDPAEFQVRWFNYEMEKGALESELFDRRQAEERQRLREEAKARQALAEELNPQIEARRAKAREYEREAKVAEQRYEKTKDAGELEEAKRLRDRAAQERRAANEMQKQLRGEVKVKNAQRVYRPDMAIRRTQDRILDLFHIQAGSRGEAKQALTGILLDAMKTGYVGQETLETVLRQMYRTGIEVVPAPEIYQDIANTLKGRKIYVSGEVKAEYGDDWNHVRRQLLGAGIYTTSDRAEMGVDSVYAELAGQYPGVFDENNVDMRGMLDELLEAAQLGKAQHRTLSESAAAQGLDSEEDFWNLYRLTSEELARFADAAGVESRVRSAKEWQIAQQQEESSARQKKLLAASRARAEEIRRQEQGKRQAMLARRQRTEMMDRLRRQITRLNRKAEQNDALLTKALRNLDEGTVSLARQAMETVDLISNGFRKSTQKDLLALRESIGLAKQDNPDFEEDALEILKNALQEKAEYRDMEAGKFDQRAKARLDQALNALDRLGKRQLTDMNIDDLNAMADAIEAIVHEIDNLDKMLGELWDANVDETANRIREEVGRAKGISRSANNSTVRGKARHLLVEQSLSPSRMLARLVGYDRSGAMGNVIREFEQGDLRSMQYALDADLIFGSFLKDRENQKWLRRATGKNAELITLELPLVMEYGEGDAPVYDPEATTTVQVSQMMLVQMALDLENEANIRHAERGGYTFPNVDAMRKENREAMYTGAKVVKMPREVIARIVQENLSGEGQAFARLLHRYYNGTSKTAINETSQMLHGVDVARVKNYYPIHTNDDYRGQEYNVFDATLESMGSLKERQQGAVAPILLEDAAETFRWHRDNMAKYVGYAVARRNFVALLNHRNAGGVTLRAEIEQKWGNTAGDSIDEFFRILETGKLEEVSDVLSGLQSKYAGAVLSFNVGSMMKQLGALPLAGSTVGHGAILRGLLNPKLGRKQREFIRKYTPYLDYRGKGYTYREIAEAAGKGIQSERVYKTLDYLTGRNWLEAMDIKVNTSLWHAAEYAVRRDTALRPGSQADIEAGVDPYYKAVADVFNRMTHDTQTNYNLMSRPPVLMRKGTVIRAATMFRTDAYQVTGVLRESIGAYAQAVRNRKAAKTDEARAQSEEKARKAGQTVARSIAGVIGNSMISVIVDELRQLLRGKDEDYFDEEGNFRWGSAAAKVGQKVLMNVAGCFTFVEEIAEYLEAKIKGERYYEPETSRLGMLLDGAESLWKFGETVWNIVRDANELRENGGDVESYLHREADAIFDCTKDMIEKLSFMLGIPLKNMERTITTALRWILPEAAVAYDDMFTDYSKALLRDMSERELPYGIDAYLRDNCSITDDEVRDEYLRLYQTVGDSMMPGANPPDKIVNGEGEERVERELTLTDTGRWDSKYREIMIDETKRMIESEAYKNLTDKEKAEALAKLDEYAKKVADEYIGHDVDAWVERSINVGADAVNISVYKAATKDMKSGEAYQWISESGMTQEEAIEVLGVEMQDKDGHTNGYHEMVKAVNEHGIELSEWADLYELGSSRVEAFNKWCEDGLKPETAITLAETMDALEPEHGKEQISDMQKYRAIDASGLNDEEKLNAMSVLLGMEMETESGEPSQRAKMLRVVETGASLTDYLDIKEAGGVDNYLEAVDLGLNRGKAKEVVEAVAALPKLQKGEEYTSDQKKLAALSVCDTAEEQIIVYATYGSSDDVITTTAKFTAAAKYDATPEMYLKAKALAKADFNKDNNNSLNSKEVEAALRSMDLTNRQRAALWQMFGIKWKKNPFGNTADIRTAYEKAVEEKKKQKD